jgi:hypothetical protein
MNYVFVSGCVTGGVDWQTYTILSCQFSQIAHRTTGRKPHPVDAVLGAVYILQLPSLSYTSMKTQIIYAANPAYAARRSESQVFR